MSQVTQYIIMTLPSLPNFGDKQSIYYSYEYTLLGDNAQRKAAVRTVEYTSKEAKGWEYYFQASHSTGGGGVVGAPVSGIENGNLSKSEIRAGGYGFTHNASQKNLGYEDITDTEFVLYQNLGDNRLSPASARVNMNVLIMSASRESTNYPWTRYSYSLIIRNDKDGGEKITTVAPLAELPVASTTASVVIPVATLAPGEYIAEVHIIPYGADGASPGVYTAKNSFAVHYRLEAWKDKTYPNGSAVPIESTIPMTWKITYFDKLQNKLIENRAGSTYLVYYRGEIPSPRGQFTSTDGNIDDKKGGGEVNYVFSGYNAPGAGGNWKDPMIILRLPAGGKLVNQDSINFMVNGVSAGPAKVTTISEATTADGYSVYRIASTPSTVSSQASLDAGFTVPFTFVTNTNVEKGSYSLSAMLTSNDPKTFQAISESNNILPTGVTRADFGLASDENFAYFYSTAYANKSFSIAENADLVGRSYVQSSVSGGWSEDAVVAANYEDDVNLKLNMVNDGNISYTDVKLFDIIPYAGYLGSSGSLELGTINIPAGSTIYYYHGATPFTNVSQIDQVNLSDGNWNSTQAGATAFYVDFGNRIVKGGEFLEVIIPFIIPPKAAGDQTVYNQFSYKAKASSDGVVKTFLSTEQGFTTVSYHIAFEANTGLEAEIENLPEAQSGVFSNPAVDKITITANQPTRTHYTFVEWNSKSDGTGTKYKAGDIVSFTKANPSLKLYPVWKIVTYTVTFDDKGATTAVTPGTASVNANQALGAKMPANPAKATFVFGGWSTVDGGAVDFTKDTPIVGNMTVYAVWGISNYTVSFNTNSGGVVTAPGSASVAHGATLGAAMVDVSWTGRTFDGWFTAAVGGTKVLSNTAITSSMELFAHWTAIPQTVTFKMNDGTANNHSTPVVVDYGASITAAKMPANPTRQHYVFGGWTNNKDSKTSDFNGTSVITTTKDVYAIWTLAKYTITFNDKSATTAVNPTSMEITYGQTLDTSPHGGLPTPPKKTNYVFGGWATVDGSVVANFAGDTPIDKSQTVYAVWNILKHKVTFNTNSGGAATPTPTNVEVNHGEGIGANLLNVKWTGRTFKGWFTAATGGTKVEATTPIVADIEIFAQWANIPQTVTFKMNDGTAADYSTPRVVVYGDPITLAGMPVNPQRTGYGFGGWATTKNATTSNFDGTTPIISNMEVFAIWNLNEYTVKFNTNSGAVVNAPTDEKVGHGAGLGVKLVNLNWAGRTFDGWYTAAIGGTKVESTTPIIASIEIFAHWTIIPQTVTFKMNDGTTDDHSTPITVDYGNTITEAKMPVNPQRTGYGFGGWATKNNVATSDFNGTTPIISTQNVYAIWTLNKYAVTYKANADATVADPTALTVNHGSNLVIPAISWPGHKFMGWYTTAVNGDKVDSTNIVTAAITIYAQWDLEEYTATFMWNDGTNREYASKSARFNTTLGGANNMPTPPIRDSHKFVGWTTNTATEAIDFKENTNVVGNITLHAVWEIYKYDVIFHTLDANKQWVRHALESTPYGEAVSPMPDNPILTGNTFGGWSTTKGGTVANFNNASEIRKSTDVYAIFVPNPYSVSFMMNDGTTTVHGTKTAIYGTGLGSGNMPADPTRHGYVFTGWATTNTATAADFTATTIVEKATTIYAVWELGDHQITIEHYKVGYDGTVADAVLAETTYGAVKHTGAYTAEPKTYEYYSFDQSISNGLTIGFVDNNALIKLYYRAEKFEVVSFNPDITVIVNDKYPKKDNSISLDEFIVLSNVATGKSVTRARAVSNYTITSSDFASLNFNTATQDHGQKVNLEVKWVTGQTEKLTVNVKVADNTSPEITTGTQVISMNKFLFNGKITEADLMAAFKYHKTIAMDNYDGEIPYTVTYTGGKTFDEIAWNTGIEQGVMFNATDSSGNKSQQRAIVVTVVDYDPFAENDGKGGGSSTPDRKVDPSTEFTSGKDNVSLSQAGGNVSTTGTGIPTDGEGEVDPRFKLPNAGGFSLFILAIVGAVFVVAGLLVRRKKDDKYTENQSSEK